MLTLRLKLTVTWLFFQIQQPIYGDRDPQFINFMAPGIMITIIFTLTIGLTALMFVIEKKEGLLDRGWAAGVSTLEIMMAHVASKLLIMAIQITLLILITNLVFNVSALYVLVISQRPVTSFREGSSQVLICRVKDSLVKFWRLNEISVFCLRGEEEEEKKLSH